MNLDASIPSFQVAADVLDGKRGALVEEVTLWGGRAFMIGAGLYLGGVREERQLIKGAMISSAIITSFATLMIWKQKSRMAGLSGAKSKNRSKNKHGKRKRI